MVIIITASAPDLDAAPDPRFGRAPVFILVDPDTLEWQAFDNPARDQADYCAISALKYLLQFRPAAVVSGHFGPKAIGGLQGAGIPAYQYSDTPSVRSVAEAFRQGALTRIYQATVPGHHAGPTFSDSSCLFGPAS